MIENWDWNIGRIRQALSETGLAADTRLMIFSDHGDMHGSNGQFHKTTPFEEAIKIPFIIGGEQPTLGSVTGSFPALLNSVDIAPTTLGLCGIAKPGWMEGKDFSTYHEPDSAYLQNVIPTGHPDSTNKPYRGLITRDGWKYVAFANTSWLMFDLNDDPYEQVNLAHNNKARVQRKKLIARLRQWISDTGDQFELPDN
jgi:arylsulfatase A-like enzyme